MNTQLSKSGLYLTAQHAINIIFPTNDILNPIESVLLEGVLQLLKYSQAEN
jgi:hypothetical protein